MEFFVASITVLLSLLIALFVLFNNRKSATNVYFSALIFLIALYPIFNYLSLNASTSPGALFWAKAILFAAIPAGPLFFLFVRTFPSTQVIMSKKTQIMLLVWTLINLTFAYFGFIFKSVDIVKGEPVIKTGTMVISFGLLHIATILGGAYYLAKKYRESTGILKLQLKYITFGIIISFTLTILATVVLPLLFKFNTLIPISPIFLLIAGISSAYSIIKHRLLDVRMVVARAVSFALLVTMLSVLYVLFSVTLSSVIIGVYLEFKIIGFFTLLTLLLAASFQPLRKILERTTDRVFYKDRYDANQLLYSMAITMASTLNLEELTTKLIKHLLHHMKLTKGSFVLTSKDYIYRVVQEGYISKQEIDQEHINIFLNQDAILIYDEIQDGNLKDIMRGSGFSIIIPLRTEKEEVGLLALGGKLSGDMYNDEDLRVLRILAPEIAVAIQNTKAYEEIQKFNFRLKEEIDKATKDSTEMTQRIYKMNTQLHQLDKLKDDFVSVASHELRTPMAAIRSYTWMAINRSDIPLSEKLTKYLTRILISTERLINLVNDMLNISRIESGRIAINPKVFDVQELVNEVMGEVDAKAKEKGLHLDVMKMQLPEVFADPDKVHQVLLNLVGNAMKFTPQDGHITISYFSDGKVLETSVKDSGVGIAKEDISRLFQKFGRLDNSYVAMGTSGGTGLGLFICKSLVELMHGIIKAFSEGQGKGSTFMFTLPVATEDILKNAEKYEVNAVGEAKGLEPVAI